MAGYNEIKGLKVKYLSDDPSNAENGQVWYNSTTGNLRVQGIGSGTWVSSTNLPTGRDYGTAGGTSTAGFIAGGELGPGTFISTTFDYDGSGWAASGAMGDARIRMNLGVSGTQTAGLGVGGYSPGVVTAVEEYDGSSWSGGGALPTATQQSGGAGPQTSYMMLGTDSDRSEGLSYNGSAWGAEGSSSQGFAYGALAGQETAALAFYGATSPSGSNRSTGEEYNGTAWTTVVPSLPNQGNSGGAGGTTSGAVFAGNGTTARYWDGTAVAATTSMANPRANFGCIGGNPGAFVAAGGNSGLAATEEFNFGTNTITAAAWASGGAYPTAILQLGGAGTQTAGLGFGGNGTGGNPNGSVISAEYNGSSWTSSGDLNQKGNTGSRTGVGTQTAALCVARRNDGTPSVSPVSYIAMNNVEEYNGSAWSNSPTLPAATVESGSTGTTVAALYFGGSPGNPPSGLSGQSLYWNDTSWTATPSLNTSRAGIMSAFQGTYNASLGFGGSTGAPAYGVTNTELYNGSSWTNLGVMIEQKNRGSGHGTSTAALAAAGQNPSTTTNTQIWNGTNWSTSPSTATAQYFQGGGGSSTAAVIFAGADPSAYTTATQEFTGQTSVAAPASTLTTS